MSKDKGPARRKRLYLSAAIQGRLLTRLCMYWMVYHFFIWHAFFLSDGLSGDRPGTFLQRYWGFFVDNYMLLACAVAMLPIVLWDMLKLSHRIVGPFFRMEKTLQKMTSGQAVEPIVLRKHDLVYEFVDVLNDFIKYRNAELAEHSRGKVGRGDNGTGTSPRSSESNESLTT